MKLRLGTPPPLTLGGRPVSLDPSRIVGSGGEADVYEIPGGQVLKLFKAPEHPDFAGAPQDRMAAADRLAEHQRKLPALLRMRLPERVVGPSDLVLRGASGPIAGYTMPFIRDADVLHRFTERPFRQKGVPWSRVEAVLGDLHRILRELHAAGIVIGDLNDLNVLVRGNEAYLIDVDSVQFPPFRSTLFTLRFLDPLLCDGTTLALARPHNADSDWYAYAALALQLLLFVGPYGGVYKPARSRDRLRHDERPLRRITIFHPEVQQSRQAIPHSMLPDDLLHYFHRVFVSDARGPFPWPLLEGIRWTRCRCGTEHARSVCPRCAAASRPPVRLEIATGAIAAEEILVTEGVIVAAEVHEERLLWLVHDRGRFVRENGSFVAAGELDPRFHYALQARSTVISTRDEAIVFAGDRVAERLQAPVATNSAHRYWIRDGQLCRDGWAGPEPIGTTLQGQTRFWVGETFGFGFYRAAGLETGFVFGAGSRGINDSVPLPSLRGQLLDADAVFDGDRCWFFTSVQDRGRIRNRCVVIRRDGSVAAAADGEPGAGWLGRIRGNCAAMSALLVATDDGIERVETDGAALVRAAAFPETRGLVDGGTRLLAGKDGLYAVDRSRIRRLALT